MLKDLNAQERDTITFEVTVNYEGITYKWLKNGVEVKSSDRCQVRSRQLTHTLSIRNVHFGDGGEYQFVAGSAATSANLFVEGNNSSRELGRKNLFNVLKTQEVSIIVSFFPKLNLN